MQRWGDGGENLSTKKGGNERFNAKRVGRWPGGYVRTTKSGRVVYVIELWRHGRKQHVSTGCSTIRAAMKELERFELDPLSYEPGGVAPGAVLLTAELVLAYREHLVRTCMPGSDWPDTMSRFLADWQEALSGRDLRTLNAHRDLKPVLFRWRSRNNRYSAIKGFFSWLREERGLIERHQDATLDLVAEPIVPEKQRRRKVVPPEDVAAVLRELPQPHRDALHLMTATAWHYTEVRRFAAAGEIVTPMRADGVLAVLITRHKSGDLTKTPLVYPEHLAAARRIRERGTMPTRVALFRQMHLATERAGVPHFGAGQIRHCVLTWGVRDGGASKATAKDFAHHRSERTTERFYLDLDIPRDALPVYQLLDEEKAG